MTLAAPVTALAGLVLTPVYIRLAFAVIAKRKALGVAVGNGSHPELEAAIRAHGNFSEYVPFTLILILAAELNGTPSWLAAPVALMLLAGRLFHASAIASADIPKRVRGMKLTFAALALGALLNLVAVIRALL